MTHQENPDPLGSLFGGLVEPTAPEHEKNHLSPTRGDAAAVGDRPFPTRRELRAQREAAARGVTRPWEETPTAHVTPAVPPAPASAAAASAEFDALLLGSGVAVTSPVAAAPVAPARVAEPPAMPAPAPVSYAAPVRRRSVTPEELIRQQPTKSGSRRSSAERRPSAPRHESRSRSLRQRITATGTMVVVGGIFASLTLPAYAFPDQVGVQSAAKQTASQTLSVADGQVAPVTRDAFGVTSAADLKTLYANGLRQKNLQAYLNSGARAMGDDYPWAAELTRSEGGGLSPLRYYYRECVDFVAWRLNRDAGSTSAPFKWDWSSLTPGNGDASGWKSAWSSHGWAMGTTPQVGSVAWFGGQNHVSYVSGILGDGSVVLEEYNWNNNHVYDQRIVKASDVSMFLYAPPK